MTLSVAPSSRAALREQYFAGTTTPRLHIGCGRHILPGWLNTDIHLQDPALPVYLLDGTRDFPFADATFDSVFSEHMIEHIPYPDGLHMLRECRRVLKPGGVLRLSTPDLDFLLGLRRPDRSPLQEAYVRWASETNTPEAPERTNEVFVINYFVRAWGHTFIYDAPTLVQSLRAAGFDDVQRCELGASSRPALCNLENEARMPAGFLRLESMVFEATRPAAPA
ncbi:MAG: methyltransferase domain-containing protein [Proteobacteria bacterium]|nr:methyltransferase domain-containing protein [Pseudomonadota bacterium]